MGQFSERHGFSQPASQHAAAQEDGGDRGMRGGLAGVE